METWPMIVVKADGDIDHLAYEGDVATGQRHQERNYNTPQRTTRLILLK